MSEINLLYQAFIHGAPICTDTRNIQPGCIFFALKGENFNGNTFAETAVSSGAAFAVIDEVVPNASGQFVLVKNVLTCLQRLALHHRKQLNIPVIAITGSNGKTTTKELVNRVLSKKFKTLCTKGNLNNHIGVPLTLLSIKTDHEIAIIEMGANHQKEIELLCSLALPTHVLITNVGKAHLEGFGGFEGVKKGKGEMYRYAASNKSHVFLNDDSTDLKSMLGKYEKVTRYGNNENCDIIGAILSNSSHVALQWKRHNKIEWQNIQSMITGNYNFENILSAISIGVFFGVPDESIKSAIESYAPDNQRSQEIIKGSTRIILDAYNANPTSMEAALRNFNAHFSGKRAVFLGDMLELGESTLQEHKSVIKLLQSFSFDVVVLVGKYFIEAGIPDGAMSFNTSSEAAEWTRKQQFGNYNILIKGSRGSKMEIVLEGISESA